MPMKFLDGITFRLIRTSVNFFADKALFVLPLSSRITDEVTRNGELIDNDNDNYNDKVG